MRAASLFAAGLLALSHVVASPSATNVEHRSTTNKRWNDGFVRAEGGKFKINDKDFFFAGTTAYWLTQVQFNEAITTTLTDVAADNFKVVRMWGFREVVGETNDDPATFTQQWVNGEQKCNQAGIDRLKFTLDEAEKRNLFVQLVLTNNWAPDFPPGGTGNQRPGYLSNSYGGIDTYVKQIHPDHGDHDLFYTDDAVKAAFKNWLSCIVPQLANHKALLAWELVNDLRCQGAEGTTTSGNCNTQTITRWVAEISQFVKSLDPNHMVASGDGGFFCPTCEKINSHTKRTALKRRNSDSPPIGPGFDGSQGIDAEDILRIPTIDFASFQLFPDQFNYAAKAHDPSVPAFDSILQDGLDWIDGHVTSATAAGKPLHFSGFGLVSAEHAPFFVPFNSTRVADTFIDDTSNDTNPADWDDTLYGDLPDIYTSAPARRVKRTQRVSSDRQQRRAYAVWVGRAVKGGSVNGITNYQRSQNNLSHISSSKRSINKREGYAATDGSATPDDGYATAAGAMKQATM
ncbi:hypothetical protein FS837_009340 [Tulasnella sp. UAMH 9824]|nr:hypothetical protein FS837_009340 [Tulasnella sp. UAMH 9824]